MQNYSALVHPGLAEKPFQEVNAFPDADVLHVQEHLYSSSECTFKAWKSLKSYFSAPFSYQLPLSKATEILLDEKEDGVEEHDVFVSPSSPEQTEPNHVNPGPVNLLSAEKSALNLGTTLDSSGEAQSDLTDTPQSASANNFAPLKTKTDTEKAVLSRMNTPALRSQKTPAPSTSDLHHPAELIVSFTSAERAVNKRSVINDKHGFQLSHHSTDKVKAMDDQTVAPEKGSEDQRLRLSTTAQRTELKGPAKGQKRGPRTYKKASNLQVNDYLSPNEEFGGSERTVLNRLRQTHARKVHKNTIKKLLRNKEIRYFYACQREKRSSIRQKSIGTFMNSSHPQRKTERSDLKPVVSECGRVLVPHGQRGNVDRTGALNDVVCSTKAEADPQRKLLEVPTNPNETSDLDPKPIVAQETSVGGTEATMPKDESDHSENAVSQVSLEHNVLRQSGDEDDQLTPSSEGRELCSKKDSPCDKKVQENHSSSPEKCVTKNDALLNKLKSVLLRGKRRAISPVLKDTAVTIQDTESLFKKSKVDLMSDGHENADKVPSVQQPTACTTEAPMCSVDPHFASALGLTPKQKPQIACKMPKNEDDETQSRNESSDKKMELDCDKDQATQSQLFYPRRGRLKALKKHQSVSTEHVKKNCKLFVVFLIFQKKKTLFRIACVLTMHS